MDPLAVHKMSLKPQTAAQQDRAKAEKVANQFEAVFVKTLVGALRQTSSFGGEGGMFGSGPGSDTFTGWFDQNVADHLAETGGLGVASAVLSDMERHGALESVEQTSECREVASRLRRAAADGPRLTSANAQKGGFDVVL